MGRVDLLFPPVTRPHEVEVAEVSDIKDRAVIDRPPPGPDAGAGPPQPDAANALTTRLQARHLDASPAMVQHSIDQATALFRDARVRLFLPILIERAASAALAAALGSTCSSAARRHPPCRPSL